MILWQDSRCKLDIYEFEAFWSKVQVGQGCWIWQGSCFGNGYGQYKNRLAHRESYKMLHGELSDDMNVLHHCDNPKCVRPSHLFIGTQADNIKDMFEKGRDYATKRRGQTRLTTRLVDKPVLLPSMLGSKNHQSKLTEAQVVDIYYRSVRDGDSRISLAREFSVSSNLISQIVLGKAWNHVTSRLRENAS